MPTQSRNKLYLSNDVRGTDGGTLPHPDSHYFPLGALYMNTVGQEGASAYIKL